MKICLATNNINKVNEIKQVLGPEFSVLSLADIGCTEELPETRKTIAGNACQKAEYVWEKYGVDCFADDTGLEVIALNGEPGVDSAMYAGPQRSSEDNMNLLLKNLAGKANRSARFITVIALYWKGALYQFEGVAEGEITAAPSGKEGFGYDPIFRPDGQIHTFAQMDALQKNQISHRGKAVRQLVAFLHEKLRHEG